MRWTPEAITTFDGIINYLEKYWSEKEVDKFILATDRVIRFISVFPRMFRSTNKKNIHEALVTSHNLLIYKVCPTHIDILTFWDTRQYPLKKKY